MPDLYYDTAGKFLFEECGILPVRYFQEVTRRSDSQLGTIYTFKQVDRAPAPVEDFGE